MAFAAVEDLVRAIGAGQMVIIVDDEDRENEGDLVMAGEHASSGAVNFMVTKGRGLICAPLAPEYVDRLGLPPMAGEPDGPIECAFTVSVDAREGVTTGISAFDRAHTARLLADRRTRPADLKRPGHMFPLRARADGVLERPGHTEAAVDLARLAGCTPVGLICEIMRDDGNMARLADLERIARHERLLLGRISDIREHRLANRIANLGSDEQVHVRHLSAARLPTPLGVFHAHVFENQRGEEIVALTMGDLASPAARADGVLTRVHSQCFTGDVLGSLRCDCGGQLQMALRLIGEAEQGLLIYLPQEGRGIGLAKKIEAYALQEGGIDTVEANHRLGFSADLRSYEDAASVLRYFEIDRVRLLTNNPAKIRGLIASAIEVAERVPLEAGPGPVNLSYLKAKKGKLGHLFRAV